MSVHRGQRSDRPTGMPTMPLASNGIAHRSWWMAPHQTQLQAGSSPTSAAQENG